MTDYTELRALADAATPGPWWVDTEIDGWRAGRRTVVKAKVAPAEERAMRVVTVDQTRPHWDADAEANVELIAAARSAVPQLLDEIDRLTRELAAVENERNNALYELMEASRGC